MEVWAPSGVPIVKAGSDASSAAVVDVHLVPRPAREAHGAHGRAAHGRAASAYTVEACVSFEEVARYEPAADVQRAVDAQTQVLRALQSEVVCSAADFACTWRASPMLDADATSTGAGAVTGGDTGGGGGGSGARGSVGPGSLDSIRTRYRQTSVGAVIAAAVREVLMVDVAAINGGSIKGNRVYDNGEITYLELQKVLPFPLQMMAVERLTLTFTLTRALTRAPTLTCAATLTLTQELPFPLKMIAVEMPGSVLQAAVSHSRAGPPDLERRGYLQLDGGIEVDEAADHTIMAIGGVPFDPAATYQVAVPRNLFKGIFDVRPLVDFAKAHPEALGDQDKFLPAFNLVIMNQARRIWHNLGSFQEIDLNGDGVLSREEIEAALQRKLGTTPSPFLVDNVVRVYEEQGTSLASGAVQPTKRRTGADRMTAKDAQHGRCAERWLDSPRL